MRADGVSRVVGVRLALKGSDRHTMKILGHNEESLLLATLSKAPSEHPDIHLLDDSECQTLKIVYGQYRPDFSDTSPHGMIKHQVTKDLEQGKLIAFDHQDEAHYCIHLDVEDILLSDTPIDGFCSHCEDKHSTNYVAFAALLRVHSAMDLREPYQAGVAAFVHNPDQDVVTNFYNRAGIYVFDLEETEIPNSASLTRDNWQEYVKMEKARLVSQYI